MVKNRRNARWFWYLTIVLVLAASYLIIAAATVDDCGRDAAKTWNWVPPKWECTRRT